MSSNTLVTGANGFIGEAVVQALFKRGHLVRRCTRRDGVFSDVSVGDIGPATDWSEALIGVNNVIHLAGRAHILTGEVSDPLSEFRKVNSEGTINLARQAVSSGVERFIFISSIGVNGSHNSRPFVENDDLKPETPYAISKLEAEQGLRKIAAGTCMDAVIIRPPLVYGPNAPGNFRRLINAVAKGKFLPLASVHNKRSMVALDNLADLIVTCIDHPLAANQTFLVSDGEDVSTTELVERMASALGKPVRLFPFPLKLLMIGAGLLGKQHVAKSLLGSLQVDISKVRNLLGWVPQISVDDAIKKTAHAFLEGK